MREYIKPSVQIVDIKSTEDIALTYDQIAKQLVGDGATDTVTSNGKSYTVQRYLVSQIKTSEVPNG